MSKMAKTNGMTDARSAPTGMRHGSLFNTVMVCEKLDAFILPTAFAALADASSDEEIVMLMKRTLVTDCEHGLVSCRRIAPPTRERGTVELLEVLLH